MTKISLLTLNLVAAAVLVAERFVTTDGNYATAAGPADGVSATAAAAIGDMFPADHGGIVTVVAGGAIAKNAYVQVGASGKAVTHSTGVPVAKALDAAAADGDRIRVLFIPNGPLPA